jgi:hypothetical protein
MALLYIYLFTVFGFIIGWFACHVFRSIHSYPIQRRRLRVRRTGRDRLVRMNDKDVAVERFTRGAPPVRRVDVLVDRAEVDFVRQVPRFGETDAV